jgi:hypothetical protein
MTGLIAATLRPEISPLWNPPDIIFKDKELPRDEDTPKES